MIEKVEFRESLAAEYQPVKEFGAEVSSALACAAKRCWAVTLDEEKLKEGKKGGKPRKTAGLLVCNKTISTTAPHSARKQNYTQQRV